MNAACKLFTEAHAIVTPVRVIPCIRSGNLPQTRTFMSNNSESITIFKAKLRSDFVEL